MKAGITILIALMLLSFVQCDVEVATDADSVRKFLEDNQDHTVALFFIDSSLNEGSEGGFWKGITTSISHIFSGEDEAAATNARVAEIEKDISTNAALIQIDVSNEKLRDIQESYDVTTVPFLIVFKRGIVVLKEVPTHETHDKILQVLNVNPAAVHAEDEATPVATEPEAAAAAPEVAPEAAPEAAPAEVVETPAKEPATQPPKVAPVNLNRGAGDQTNRHITLAPGDRERNRPTPQRKPVAADERRKYVHHTWHDVTTYDDNVAANWRKSPFYIKELEDYEIPEDWWRNGYTPLAEPEKKTPEKKPEPKPVEAPKPVVAPRPVMGPSPRPRVAYAPPRVEQVVAPAPVSAYRPVVRERFEAPRVANTTAYAPAGGRVVSVREVPSAGQPTTTTTRPATTTTSTVKPTTTTSTTRPTTTATTRPTTTTTRPATTTTARTPTRVSTAPVRTSTAPTTTTSATTRPTSIHGTNQ